MQALDAILVDPERVTWPAPTRVLYLNLALNALREARPDAFVEDVDITLKPGTFQELPPDVSAVVGSPRGLNANGEVSTTEVSLVDKNTITAFSAFGTCPTSATSSPNGSATGTQPVNGLWEMKGFEFSPKSPRFFSVIPPVPEGQAPKIRIQAQRCQQEFRWPDDQDTVVQCRHKAALLEMVLYYAYQTPQESELAMTRAAQHAQRFERMLGFNYRMESRYQGGYFLGKKPDGQPDEQVVR